MTRFPDFRLDGRIALITGAARGIGRAAALAFAHAGADLALGFRDRDTGADLVAHIEAMGRRALALQMDLLKLDEVRAAVAAAAKHFGRIDILVNNVGIGPENAAENVVEPDFDLTMDVNVKGTFFVTQAVGRLMIAQKSGRIITMSSQAGRVVLKGESVYCMSKAAIDHMTRCLAIEWAEHGITVNGVAPTFIWTDATRPMLADPDFHARTLAHIPLGRIGDPEDVTGALLFLASPAASLITGETLLVDGGWAAL
jgi:NAD(P)-dependent dehydrogenase (short-subunit alcohol dehydrogenase family)